MLRWQRYGNSWLLLHGRRRMGRVVPDTQYPGTWRAQWPDGSLSDMANLSRAKDAVARLVETEERRQRARQSLSEPRLCA